MSKVLVYKRRQDVSRGLTRQAQLRLHQTLVLSVALDILTRSFEAEPSPASYRLHAESSCSNLVPLVPSECMLASLWPFLPLEGPKPAIDEVVSFQLSTDEALSFQEHREAFAVRPFEHASLIGCVSARTPHRLCFSIALASKGYASSDIK